MGSTVETQGPGLVDSPTPRNFCKGQLMKQVGSLKEYGVSQAGLIVRRIVSLKRRLPDPAKDD